MNDEWITANQINQPVTLSKRSLTFSLLDSIFVKLMKIEQQGATKNETGNHYRHSRK